MTNINIAELLKDCPKDTELYSPIFGNVYLCRVRPSLAVIVRVSDRHEEFLYDGRFGINGECMLFPSKENRDWSTFRLFKDGDVVATEKGKYIGIVKIENGMQQYAYVAINEVNNLSRNISYGFSRLATEEEKEKLFKTINDNGYVWDPETKTLGPKFKDGDVVFYNDVIAIFKEWGDATLFRTYVIKYLCNDSLIDKNVPLFGKYIRKETRFATEVEKQKLFEAIKENGYQWDPETKTLEKLITLKFKIGDQIRAKGTNSYTKILGIKWDQTETYYETLLCKISVKDQDKFELVPNKFSISTLKPFESRVLVRDYESEEWYPAIWGLKTKDVNYPYGVVSGNSYKSCIPYEGNEHLLGTTNDCDNYYKIWE